MRACTRRDGVLSFYHDAGQPARTACSPQQLVQHKLPPRPGAQLGWLQCQGWGLDVERACNVPPTTVKLSWLGRGREGSDNKNLRNYVVGRLPLDAMHMPMHVWQSRPAARASIWAPKLCSAPESPLAARAITATARVPRTSQNQRCMST